jgi:hypothetical protein
MRSTEAFAIALGRVHCPGGVCSAHNLRFRRPVPCRGAARAFGARLLVFSEKQTFSHEHAYLALQRVRCATTQPLGVGRPARRPTWVVVLAARRAAD